MSQDLKSRVCGDNAIVDGLSFVERELLKLEPSGKRASLYMDLIESLLVIAHTLGYEDAVLEHMKELKNAD